MVRLSIIASLMLGLAGLITYNLLSVGWSDGPATSATTRGLSDAYSTRDSSGNEHHGVMQGNVETGLHGHFGGAYSFAERGSWVEVPPAPELDPESSDFLVSAWINLVNVPDPGQTYDLVIKGDSSTLGGGYKMELIKFGGLRCTVRDSSNEQATVAFDSPQLADGLWHYVACGRTGDWVVAVVDGRLRKREALLGSVSNTMSLSIGSRYGWDDPTRGRLDDVSLVVSPQEPGPEPPLDPRAAVQELQGASPVATWHLDEEP